MHRLLVSIVTHNNSDGIEACLAALKNQTYQEFDVVVIDNASTDNTINIIKSEMPEAKIVPLKNNIGFGAAHNIAIAAAEEWILLVNPDLVFENDAIEQLMRATNKPGFAAIGPCLYRDHGKQVVDTTGLMKNWFYKVIDRRKSSPSSEVWGISGACVLYRKIALEEVAYKRSDRRYDEYFDENFFMYKEDLDLAARLSKKGWKAWHQAEAVGYHDRTGHAPQSVTDTGKHRHQIPDYINTNSYRNHIYFLIKNVPLISAIPALGYEFGKLVYLLIFERRTLKALKQIPKRFMLMLRRRYA